MRANMARSSALITGGAGEFADEADVVVILQWKNPVVFKKHGAFFGDPNRHFMPLVHRIVFVFREGGIGFLRQRGDARGAVIEGLLGQGALFHRSKQGFGTLFQHARHLQVQPVVVGSDGIVNRAPIRNHDALISPFAFQNIPQKLLIFAGINPIDFVVAGHDRPRGGFLHGDFEWAQIDFPQRPFIDDRVIDHAVILLAVAGEVLQARADVLVLQAVDVGRSHLPGQKGIFGKIFEVPSAEGIPFDIGSGGKQNVGLLKMRLFAQSPAKLTFKLNVPAARGQTRGRKANRDLTDL